MEKITMDLLPVGNFQQLINVNRSWLILMQSCGNSAEFERNPFKCQRFTEQVSLSSCLWRKFQKGTKKFAQSNIVVPKCRICQNNFKINIFCVGAVDCKMASGLRKHFNLSRKNVFPINTVCANLACGGFTGLERSYKHKFNMSVSILCRLFIAFCKLVDSAITCLE